MIKRVPLFSFFAFAALLLCFTAAVAQQPAPADTAAVNRKRIQVISAERMNYEKIDTSEFQSLVKNVVIRQEKTMFYCDSAVINRKINVLEAFGHVHINDADSVHTYSDYLRYIGNEKKAFLKGNVKLTDGKGVLTTPELEYTTTTKLGIYTKGGKLVNNKSVLTSTEGYYYGDTRDVIFKKAVRLKDPEYNIETDTLIYNTYTEEATFTVPTKIISKNTTVNTRSGFYNTKSKKTYFGKRATIIDGKTSLIADEIANDSTGYGEARGNVIYRDTSQGVTILANNMKSNRNDNSFLATQQPVMILKQDAESDSLFIAADTLYSGKLSELRKYRDVPDIRGYGLKRDAGIEPQPAPSAPPGLNRPAAKLSRPPLTGKALKPKEVTDSAKLSLSDSAAAMIDSAKAAPDTVAHGPVPNKFGTMLDSVVTNDAAASVPDSAAALLTSDSALRVKHDTLVVARDSVATAKADSTDRFFEAYFNVRIYSDSLQAVGDSLFYSGEDSVFRLFRDPIIWTKDNQVTGDTIYLYTKSKKPQRMYVFENALAINKVADNFYNQIKGRTINGYFKDGNIDYMRAKGNSESVYYAQDEGNKFVGVNKASADISDMYFNERKPQRVIMRVNVKGVTYPMRQVNHDEIRIRGFRWIDERRPKSKYDLFGK